MTSFFKSALTLLAVIFATGAHAQAPAPAATSVPNPPAASVALAKEIVLAKGASNMFGNAVPGITEQIRQSYLQNNLDKQKDLAEVAAKVVVDLKGRENEIGDLMAKIYASNFTEQELKDLVAFYKTPLGKKVIEKEPLAMEQSMTAINEWSGKFQDEVVQRFKAEMKKRGKDI
jgi:hypothetical protein